MNYSYLYGYLQLDEVIVWFSHFCSVSITAAKWGDGQRVPGLGEHIQRVWDLHWWGHRGARTAWDAWRCGDGQRHRGHAARPRGWRKQVGVDFTPSRIRNAKFGQYGRCSSDIWALCYVLGNRRQVVPSNDLSCLIIFNPLVMETRSRS